MRKLHGMIKLHACTVMTKDHVCIYSLLLVHSCSGVCSMDAHHRGKDRHEQDKHLDMQGGRGMILRQCDHGRSGT